MNKKAWSYLSKEHQYEKKPNKALIISLTVLYVLIIITIVLFGLDVFHLRDNKKSVLFSFGNKEDESSQDVTSEEITSENATTDAKQEEVFSGQKVWKYVGKEDLLEEGKVIYPEVGFNGINVYYVELIEAFRYSQYIILNEDGTGALTEESDRPVGEEYDSLNFYFEDKEASYDSAGGMLFVNGEPRICRIEGDKLYLECEGGFDVYVETTMDEIEAIHNGTRGYTALTDANVGDRVIMGRYEQDTCMDNGPDPIVWRVLDIKDGKALLLSEYAIDDTPFNDSTDDVTWESCSLRTFLNGDFKNTAFKEEEQGVISLTHVVNKDYADYLSNYWLPGVGGNAISYDTISSVTGGNDTEDYIFLLDIDEAVTYLGDADGYMHHFGNDDVEADYIASQEESGISVEMGQAGE